MRSRPSTARKRASQNENHIHQKREPLAEGGMHFPLMLRRHVLPAGFGVLIVCSLLLLLFSSTSVDFNSEQQQGIGYYNNVAIRRTHQTWLSFEHVEQGEFSGDTTDGSPPPFPSENEWLIQSDIVPDSRQPFQSPSDHLIPTILHKVILTNMGKFPKSFVNLVQNETIQQQTFTADEKDNENRLFWAHKSWKMRNPNYDVRYYTLHHCRAYLKQHYHPLFLRAFDCIEAFAGKTDFFRTLVLYKDGGFYSDWKQECLVDGLLDQLAANGTSWVSAWDDGLRLKEIAMQNNFLGATPQHPILAESIRQTFVRIQSRHDKLKRTEFNEVYNATSCIVLGLAFNKVMKSRNDNEGNSVLNGNTLLLTYRARKGQRFYWGNRAVIVHKCWGCGNSQDWPEGNNYVSKFQAAEYFCPDAASLFYHVSKNEG